MPMVIIHIIASKSHPSSHRTQFHQFYRKKPLEGQISSYLKCNCPHFSHEQYRNAITATNTRGNTASTTSPPKSTQHSLSQGISWPNDSLKEVQPSCKHEPNPVSCVLNLPFLAAISFQAQCKPLHPGQV